MASLDGISEKCTGVRKVEWSDSLKGEPFTCLDVHYKTSYKSLQQLADLWKWGRKCSLMSFSLRIEISTHKITPKPVLLTLLTDLLLREVETIENNFYQWIGTILSWSCVRSDAFSTYRGHVCQAKSNIHSVLTLILFDLHLLLRATLDPLAMKFHVSQGCRCRKPTPA